MKLITNASWFLSVSSRSEQVSRDGCNAQWKVVSKSQKPVDILLVDDNPDDVEFALYALRRNQLTNHIHVVSGGIKSLDFLLCWGEYAFRNCAHNPKLVLLDLNMPKLIGLEVLKEIRSNEKTAGIPVVILTTSNEERDLIESYRLGVNSYIVKPVDFEQFSEAVRQFVSSYHLTLYRVNGLVERHNQKPLL